MTKLIPIVAIVACWLLARPVFLMSDAPAADLPRVAQYAFPASWVALKQKWVKQYWPAAECRGRSPVPLIGGGRGYRFIECIDELDNPPTRIWFHINSSGRVLVDIGGV